MVIIGSNYTGAELYSNYHNYNSAYWHYRKLEDQQCD